jgi:hypothetical protein
LEEAADSMLSRLRPDPADGDTVFLLAHIRRRQQYAPGGTSTQE